MTDANYEVTYSRGIVPGEWIVNLHAFRMDLERPPPYTVRTVVSVMRPDFNRPVQILEKQVDLTRLGQELIPAAAGSASFGIPFRRWM